jgi:hypothetical protein
MMVHSPHVHKTPLAHSPYVPHRLFYGKAPTLMSITFKLFAFSVKNAAMPPIQQKAIPDIHFSPSDILYTKPSKLSKTVHDVYHTTHAH